MSHIVTKTVSAYESELFIASMRHKMAKNGTRLGQELIDNIFLEGVCPPTYYSEDESEVLDWYEKNVVTQD